MKRAVGHIIGIAMWCIVMGLALCGCSTKKNTAGTRFFHAMTAHYNILYNGQVAFQEGLESQTQGHKDDYTQILPMYISQTPATQSLGKGNYETAILKSEKAIKLHSIKKRPVMSPSKKKTEKDKEFLKRKEFNPYLYRAWLLLAESQFCQGEFLEAAATYNYIIRLYQGQPNIVGVAKACLARCYVAMEWPYDAEDVLRKLDRDSITVRVARERDNTRAGYYILTGQYEEAIPYLKNTIRHQKGRTARARLNYLLGQLYHALGRSDEAYKALSRVIRSNPPYEMSLNARVLQTEVVGKGQARQMVKKLRRMARDENNKEYLDQVYCAMGNIYLSMGDTLHCIYAWEKGLEESSGSGYARAQLLLKMSTLYWERENYIDAARCYKLCVSILNKERDEYAEVERRSKALDPLAPHLQTIKLQDSLQVLAKMPEAEYLAVIDRVIKELKKKEKEEAKRADARQDASAQANPQNGQNARQEALARRNRETTWYFYSTETLQKGRNEFVRRWGQRKNEDNWRRMDKRDDSAEGDEAYDYDAEAGDAEGGEADGGLSDEEAALQDSLANDPHRREYYLAQIPFTEEQVEESNQMIYEALYKAGVIEQEQVENFRMARSTFERLMRQCPDYKEMEDVYYRMFLLCGRMGDAEQADSIRTRLLTEFPEGKHSQLLGNPNYEMIARGGSHLEDSIYAQTYESFKVREYDTVMQGYQFSSDNYPEGAHRARFMFVHAMSQLYTGHRDIFLTSLKELVEKYGSEEVAKLAAEMLKGIDGGRLLSGGTMDVSGLWSMRVRADKADGDSTQVAELSDEKDGEYCFVLAYPTGALDEDQLLFEVARYNFSAYMVRNFELEMTTLGGISMLIVRGFRGYDEVHVYAQHLYSNRHMMTVLEGIRSLLISEANLKVLGTDYSFQDYEEFYDEKISQPEIPEDLRIDENQEIVTEDPDDVDVNESDNENGNENSNGSGGDDDDFPFGF